MLRATCCSADRACAWAFTRVFLLESSLTSPLVALTILASWSTGQRMLPRHHLRSMPCCNDNQALTQHHQDAAHASARTAAAEFCNSSCNRCYQLAPEHRPEFCSEPGFPCKSPRLWMVASMLLVYGCRAARFCHAGAHGGQITAPLDFVQGVIGSWCGLECPPLTDPPSTHHLTFQQGPLADSLRPFSEFALMPEVGSRHMSTSYRLYSGWTGTASRPALHYTIQAPCH